jgi:hypothetical protein
VRSDPTFWILARASGILAYALLTSSVLAGIVLKARPFGAALKAAVVTDLHRFLALLGLGFIALHGAALVLDSTVRISVAALFVPGLVPYRPLWSSLGVLAADLMLLVYASSALFALATVHGLAAGTDAGRPWPLALYGGAVGAVTAAAGWRALAPATKGGNTRVPDRDRPLAV